MFAPAHKDDNLGLIRFSISEISSVTEIHSKGCRWKACLQQYFFLPSACPIFEATFLQSHMFLCECMCRSFESKFVTMALSQIFNALTKDTARENRANPAFGCELTLLTAQENSDIGAAGGLDEKVLRS